MAATAKAYGLLLTSLCNQEINWTTGTVKHMLCTASYTPDQDTHRYVSDVTGEVVGTGYTAGGVTASSKTIVYDTVSNRTTLDCADPTWTTTTLTARYMVTYVDTGTGSTSPLICYNDFGSDQTTAARDFIYTVATTGLLAWTTA